MFKHFAASILAATSISMLAIAAESGTQRPVRGSGGAVWSIKVSDFFQFFENGEITDRSLQEFIDNSGWTADEIQWAMTKPYDVDLVGISRFLYSDDGVKFLDGQTRNYFPYWQKKKTAVVALRSAIILDAIDGKISSAGIMRKLPVDFRLAYNGSSDGAQNVCKSGLSGNQATSLLSWYVFLPACLQANQIVSSEPVRSVTPVRGLW